MNLLVSKNIIKIPVRYSRGSLISFRRRRSLLKEFKYDKNSAEIEVESNVYKALESPINKIVPVNSSKTTVTIDALNEDTYSMLSEWRRNNLLRRARRVLPLPISLTTDEQTYHTFQQKYNPDARIKDPVITKKLLEKQLDEIPEILKMLSKDNPDVLKQLKLYENYERIQNHIQDGLQKVQKTDEDKSDTLKDHALDIRKPYFPFRKAVEDLASNEQSSEEIEHYSDHVDDKLLDEDYENFLKHHDLVQYLAKNLGKIPHYELTPEVEGWSYQDWLRNYGKPDPNIKPTNIPCSGCGAHLHCTATNIPGFMPSEKFQLYTPEELRTQFCQRCDFLKRYNVALSVTASEDDYPRLISEIKATDSLVVILVDLLDYPCSVWPGIMNLIGEHQKLYIVGNKVDLLPKDDKRYLERIRNSMKESLKNAGIDKKTKVRDVSLISAKTGHGVEDLVTKLLRDVKKGQNIYLLGCTNAGKSTLFNVLMQTDLCALRDNDLMARATTSLWPGTTLNLLKFPVRKLAAWDLKMRENRLNLFEKNDIAERKLQWTMYRQNPEHQAYATLKSRIGTTFRSAPPIGVSEDHPLRKPELSNAKPFNPDTKRFADCSFLHDTPGTLYRDQILNLLTTEELLRTIPRELITPRTFTLRPQQTLFLAGLGRIDIVRARTNVWLTVFASKYLPVNIVYTEQAKRFYQMHCGTDMLAVPYGDSERLENWPDLMPKEFTIKGIGWERSSADVVLSSAGWCAVTADVDSECIIRAFTPDARGIYVRDPPALPFAVNLRGKRLPNTPIFESKLYDQPDSRNWRFNLKAKQSLKKTTSP